MSRRILLVCSLLSAIALALPTVAAPLTDTVDSGVTLTTDNSTNAEYVRTTDDGSLVLDVSASNPALTGDGLNRNAVTYVADAVRLHYGGDGTATVWLDVDAEGITVQSRGRPVDAPEHAVELAPGDAVPIGFVVDTTEGTPESASAFTVHARVTDPEDGPTNDGPDDGGSPAAADPSVRVERPTESRRLLSLRDTVVGRPLPVDLDRFTVDRAGDGVVTLDELVVVSGEDLDLDVRVTEPDSAGSLPTDARPLGAVRVDERGGTVERATLRFGVDRAYLDATGVSPGDLRVFRYDEGERSELDLRVVDRGGDRIVVEAETPGFSTFLVAADAGTETESPDQQATAGTVEPDDPPTGTDGDGDERVGTPGSTPAEPPADTPVAPDDADSTPAVGTDPPVAEPAGGPLSAMPWILGALLALLALAALVRRGRDGSGG